MNNLYFVLEAKKSHQAYAIMRSMTTSQRDDEQDDDDDDDDDDCEKFPVLGSANELWANEPIRGQDFDTLILIRSNNMTSSFSNNMMSSLN